MVDFKNSGNPSSCTDRAFPCDTVFGVVCGGILSDADKSKGYTLRRGICGMVLSGGVDTMLLGQCKRLGEEFTGSAAFLFRSRR